MRVGHDAESTETSHIFDDIPRVAAQWIRRLRKIDGDVVAVLSAELNAVDHEDAVPILRRIRFARPVSVIGQDDEVQARARCGKP